MTLPKQKFNFKPGFQNILNILNSSFLIKIIKRFLTEGEARQGIIEKCLFIIAMAVQCNKGDWIEREGILEILDRLKSEKDADVVSLPWIKEKLGAAGNVEQEQSNQNDEKAARRKRAMEMRKAMMARMKADADKFITSNKNEFKASETKEAEEEEYHSAKEELDDEDVFEDKKDLFNMKEKVHIEETWTCIMCQDDQETTLNPDEDDPMVMVGFGEQSSTLDRSAFKLNDNDLLRKTELFADFPHYKPIHLEQGYHLSTCGHAVHLSCLDKIKRNQRDGRVHPQLMRTPRAWKSEDEFSCLLCNRLCNLAIPIIPKKHQIEVRKYAQRNEKTAKLFEWIREIEYEMSPEKKFTKKTYVLNLGTFDVNEFDKNPESDGSGEPEQTKANNMEVTEKTTDEEMEEPSSIGLNTGVIDDIETNTKDENDSDEDESDDDDISSLSTTFNVTSVQNVLQKYFK